MALDNLISIAFTPEEMLTINNALTSIERILVTRAINLTPQQRQSHGRVRYEMEVWVQKTNSYMQQNPTLVPAFIDRAEHDKDITAHNLLNPLIDRLEQMLQSFLDTNLLLGTDLYHNSLSFYRSLKAAARSNAPGASTIYADLQQQFPGGPAKKPATPTPAASNP